MNMKDELIEWRCINIDYKTLSINRLLQGQNQYQNAWKKHDK